MEHYGSKTVAEDRLPSRPVGESIKRGFLCRCPNCGQGKLFRAYLKPVDHCAVCGEDMTHQRADDFPAYLTIFIVGHIVVSAYMATEHFIQLEMWQQMLLWIPFTGAICLALLQPIKGGVIGMQWALRMHGFGGIDEDAQAAGLSRPEQA